ncbi:MAG: HPF/RaiA family ribosome-associated protein [Burkholderiaceae bacterium]
MKLPLQVSFRDMVPLPSLDGEIRRRVAKLERFVPELISCHVVVQASANRHRQGQVYAVKIDVRVPDDEVFTGEHQADEEIAVAVQGAFDAMTRRLQDYARRRRGQVKSHATQPAAQIGTGDREERDLEGEGIRP